MDLPDGVGHAPERRDDVEHGTLARVRRPEKECCRGDHVDHGAEDEDGKRSETFDEGAKDAGGDGVRHAVADEHQAEFVQAPRAGHVGLEKNKRQG